MVAHANGAASTSRRSTAIPLCVMVAGGRRSHTSEKATSAPHTLRWVMRDAPRPLTLMREPEKVAPLYPPGRTPTPEEMADHAPWLLDGARRVLETKDALGKGIWYAETLSQYAEFREASAVEW